MSRIRNHWFSYAALAAVLVTAAPTGAATFRVTNKIYEGANRDPSAEHWIMFDDTRVYDLPQIESRFVTVYDLATNQITMLDRQTRVQTRLKTADLINAAAQARAAAKTPQQQEQLGLNAKVQPSDRGPGVSIRFGNSELHTTTQTPADPAIAAKYGRFADLALRLNILCLGPPPFARMTLNDHITASGKLPQETTLTIHLQGSKQEYRSTHELAELKEEDRRKIDEVDGMLVLFREVGLKDFP